MGAFLNMLDGVLDITMMVMALLILLALTTVAVLYFIDVSQSTQAIRKNYPVIGRLRYLFEHLGVFFRQYFFAMDREELIARNVHGSPAPPKIWTALWLLDPLNR